MLHRFLIYINLQCEYGGIFLQLHPFLLEGVHFLGYKHIKKKGRHFCTSLENGGAIKKVTTFEVVDDKIRLQF